jgi:hypothetical protein
MPPYGAGALADRLPPWCPGCDEQHRPGEQCGDRCDEPLTAERREEIACEDAEQQQRGAAERQRSFFFRGPTWAEIREQARLRLAYSPPPTRRMSRPVVRRTPVRDGRTRRPGSRRSPKVTRAGPDDSDPHLAPSPAAVLPAVSRAHGWTVFTQTPLDAVRFLEVFIRAVDEHGVIGRG